MTRSRRHVGLLAGVLAAGLLVAGAACSSGVSQADHAKVQDQLKAAQAQVAQLQSQPAPAAPAPSTIIQVANLQPAPAGQAITGWDTAASKLLGIELMAQMDSSGPAAWDAAKHPLVYVSSEGPGYGSAAFGGAFMSERVKTPGLQIIDANTHEVAASATFDTKEKTYGENHGLGVSADGKWIYTQGRFQDRDAMLVINARTLKIDKVLKSRVHHVRAYKDAATGKELVLIDGWGTIFAVDPNDNQRVVGAVDSADLKGSAYLGFVDPSGKWLLISTRTGFGPESDGGVTVVDLKTWKVATRINTYDSDPIWVTFSDKTKVAYVSNGHKSNVVKIDMSAPNPAQWEVVAQTNAGTIGPYGLVLSRDEKLMVVSGKGEAAHNQGITVGLIKPDVMQKFPGRGWGADVAGTVTTDCLRNDHGLLHPEKDEIWLSCNSSFENVIFDLNTLKVSKRIPSANGGSTHNGAFVRYNPDFSGELLVDTNGFHGSALKAKLALLGVFAAAP